MNEEVGYRAVSASKFFYVRSHKCSVCHKSFSQRGYLKTHMNSHSDSKPFSCEFCAMTFFGPTNLSQHRETGSIMN